MQFADGDTVQSLGLDGTEAFEIEISDDLGPGDTVNVVAKPGDGAPITFDVRCRLDTPVEVEYWRNGGILNTVLRKIVSTT